MPDDQCARFFFDDLATVNGASSSQLQAVHALGECVSGATAHRLPML